MYSQIFVSNDKQKLKKELDEFLKNISLNSIPDFEVHYSHTSSSETRSSLPNNQISTTIHYSYSVLVIVKEK